MNWIEFADALLTVLAGFALGWWARSRMFRARLKSSGYSPGGIDWMMRLRRPRQHRDGFHS